MASSASTSVQEQVDAVQHALSMIGGTGWTARSEAEIALGRLAAWAEAGLSYREWNEGPRPRV